MGVPEPQAIQILEDLLGGGGVAEPTPPPEAVPPAAPSTPAPTALPPAQPAVPATAATQAAPGTTPPVKAPQVASMPQVIKRGTVVGQQQEHTAQAVIEDPAQEGTFEKNFAKLLTKDLELAQHDRAMAISLFQVHLDRAEVLDQMQLSMPVAQVISDNTGATLKSLELAMKAGERVHKAAELLVIAQKNGDAAALAAAKIKSAEKNGGWGDTGDLPP